jgi:hypothetical protein
MNALNIDICLTVIRNKNEYFSLCYDPSKLPKKMWPTKKETVLKITERMKEPGDFEKLKNKAKEEAKKLGICVHNLQ